MQLHISYVNYKTISNMSNATSWIHLFILFEWCFTPYSKNVSLKRRRPGTSRQFLAYAIRKKKEHICPNWNIIERTMKTVWNSFFFSFFARERKTFKHLHFLQIHRSELQIQASLLLGRHELSSFTVILVSPWPPARNLHRAHFLHICGV